jgi:hypothetical protein
LYPATADVLAFQVSATECCVGVTPVPDNVTIAGEPVALLAMVTLPVSVPATDGLNRTPNVSCCDGANVTGVPTPLKAKPVPLMLTPEIVTLALPVSVMVMFWVAALAVLTLPKLKLELLSAMVVVAATPFPVSGIVFGEAGALLTIAMPPLTLPGTCGAN